MTIQLENFTFTLEEGQRAELVQKTSPVPGIEIFGFRLSWTEENAARDDAFELVWHMPITSDLYKWTPTCGERRHLPPNWDWHGFEKSMFSLGAPVCCHYNGSGENRCTWAVSECSKTVLFKSGVYEEEGTLESAVKISVGQYTEQQETEIYLSIDTRSVPLARAIRRVTDWWESDFGIAPAPAPDAAFDPVYSFWYSYHQNITDKAIEEECARAKALGFDTCIVDDGWQTDDNSRGYAHCGDWEPAPSKIPDMQAHVRRVHALGMKYMLWFGVTNMGMYVKRYEEFKDMYLRRYDWDHFGVLDPRYKKVRDYLISVYKKALTEWELDGFKLDFIDEWRPEERNAPYSPGMDIPVLSDAVDAFMSELMTALKEIKPDVLIEYRQYYIGPYMSKYGSMFRVTDCPCDYMKNRAGICDLRMLLPGSAPHSDMLMWHRDMPAELVAVQIINVMFGVLQYSARLDEISDSQRLASLFWIGFLKEHKKLLCAGKFSAFDPHLSYTWAKTVLEGECAVGVFACDRCVQPECTDTVYIANGSTSPRVIVEMQGAYEVSAFDCFGSELYRRRLSLDGIEAIDLPSGGLCVMKKL